MVRLEKGGDSGVFLIPYYYYLPAWAVVVLALLLVGCCCGLYFYWKTKNKQQPPQERKNSTNNNKGGREGEPYAVVDNALQQHADVVVPPRKKKKKKKRNEDRKKGEAAASVQEEPKAAAAVPAKTDTIAMSAPPPQSHVDDAVAAIKVPGKKAGEDAEEADSTAAATTLYMHYEHDEESNEVKDKSSSISHFQMELMLKELQVELKEQKEQSKQAEERADKFQVELKEQSKQAEERADKFQVELKEQSKQADKFQVEQKEQTTNLTKRLDGIVTAFSPAVLYATMETCVYQIFYAGTNQTPTNHTFTFGKAGKKANLDLMSYKAASFAVRILDCLVSTQKCEWNEFPNEKPLFATIALEGLLLFVKVVDKGHLSNWPPDRNPVVHNGQLLSSLYPGMKKTPLFQQQHFQQGAQKPSAPLITDGNGAALTAKLLTVYQFPIGIDNLLSEIERILKGEHKILVNLSISNKVKAWIKKP
jgi:hypothetical protein